MKLGKIKWKIVTLECSMVKALLNATSLLLSSSYVVLNLQRLCMHRRDTPSKAITNKFCLEQRIGKRLTVRNNLPK